jgi:hypothetical protein
VIEINLGRILFMRSEELESLEIYELKLLSEQLGHDLDFDNYSREELIIQLNLLLEMGYQGSFECDYSVI